MLFIQPSEQDIRRALDSWQWLPLADKTAIRVTSFGDFYLQSHEGIWFLDTLEGNVSMIRSSVAELEELLSTDAGQDNYLFGGLVERAVCEGQVPGGGQCYDYTVSPVIGGSVGYDNVCVRSFVVAVNLKGQLRGQVRRLPADAKIAGFTTAN